jgi:hypothetical protein
MGSKLHSGGKGLADLVRRHEQALTMRGTRLMKLGLF